MSKFIAPHPLIFNGKLREIVNLERISTFTFLKATANNYGYIRFSFDKGQEQLWAYADDAALKQDVIKIYGLLNLDWEESAW